MSRLLVSTFFACILTLTAAGAPVRELGPGLTLLRLHDLSEEMPDMTGAYILDLRYLRNGSETDINALRERLREAGPLRLVLYDATPAAGVAAVMAERHANVVTLAPKGTQPTPDIEVAVDPTADRAAYDALENGTDLAVLAEASVNKRRFDEAALVQSRLRRGQPPAAPQAAAAADAGAPAQGAARQGDTAAATPPPPVDRLLQHAVRLARGLQALGQG